MEFLLKTTAVLMLVFLLFTQLLLISPYSERLYYDDLNGSPIQSYQTVVKSGSVKLDLLGKYGANSASILINGIHSKTIDSFPITLSLSEGDVVEILTKHGIPSFYVYLADSSGGIGTDMSSSTVMIVPGVNRILKVISNK